MLKIEQLQLGYGDKVILKNIDFSIESVFVLVVLLAWWWKYLFIF